MLSAYNNEVTVLDTSSLEIKELENSIKALHGEVYIHEDIDDNFKLTINFFTKIDEMYSLGWPPVVSSAKFCDYYGTDSCVFQEFLKASTFPKDCPIPKVSYYKHNNSAVKFDA